MGEFFLASSSHVNLPQVARSRDTFSNDPNYREERKEELIGRTFVCVRIRIVARACVCVCVRDCVVVVGADEFVVALS